MSRAMIDSPELLTRWQKARDTFVTAFMWGIYVYLWVPLASLLAWVAGVEFAYDVMVRAGGAQSLAEVGVWYAVIIGVILFVVTVWSTVNRLRFRGRERRGSAACPSDAELATYFGVTRAELERLRGERIVRVDVDADGRPAPSAPVPEHVVAASACRGGAPLPIRAVRQHVTAPGS